MEAPSPTATLLISCPDQAGIVAAISGFIFENSGNIVHLEQHVDAEANGFFMRLEWELGGFKIERGKIETAFEPLAERFGMNWTLHFSDVLPRVAIFVTKESHCLYDLLSRHESGELRMEIPLIISNRTDLKSAADRFGIPFHHFPITKDNKAAQESREIELLREHDVDTVVLARYMQILSGQMVKAFPNRIINIHHSFLPAFPGARPYHSAHQRGVKIIGATSHYVTEDLDEGPIISQDVIRVSHRDSVENFIRQGKDLEKVVLARAVWLHTSRRILAFENRTVVFE
jgi:formyltetrahydrofolate deformylase